MPLDRFVLIVVAVLAAVGVVVYLAGLLIAGLSVGWPGLFLLLVLVPIGLLAFVVVRVIRDRIASREDDHYDNIEK